MRHRGIMVTTLKSILTIVWLLLGFALLSGQNAFAQKRLGLFFTAEELEVWKLRAKNGPYKTAADVSTNSPGDWTRILSNANSFLSNPSAERWKGNTLGRCLAHSDLSIKPSWALGRKLRDAAFTYLITGDVSYKNAVQTELKAQAAMPGVQWSGPLWSAPMCDETKLGGTHNPVLEIHQFMLHMLLGYDFIRLELSSTDRATLDKWFLDFSNRFEPVNYKRHLEKRWPKRAADDYSSSPYSTAPKHKTHFNGPDWSAWHGAWGNQYHLGMLVHGLTGIMTDNSNLMGQAKRYFKEFVKYNIWPDGTMGDLHRWNDNGDPCKGFWYTASQSEDMAAMAEAFARTGDFELYNYTTSEGYAGTAGGSKSLKTAIRTHQGLANNSVKRYATTNATEATDPRYLIGSDCSAFPSTGKRSASPWRGVNDIWGAAIANRFYKDNAIKDGYMRRGTGFPGYPKSPNHSCGSAWEGAHCTFPGILFMFGQMEDQSSPYPSAPSPTSSPVTSPLPPQNLKITR
jgi:hypothetical protein